MILFPPSSLVDNEKLYQGFAAHEAGHLVLYGRCGVHAEASFQFNGDGELLGGMATPYGPINQFAEACVGWAGVAAEYLAGYILIPVKGVPELCSVTLGDWAKAIYPCLHSVDRQMIELERNRDLALKFAFSTLSSPLGSSRLWNEIECLVKLIRAEHRKALHSAGREFVPGSRELAAQIFSGIDGL